MITFAHSDVHFPYATFIFYFMMLFYFQLSFQCALTLKEKYFNYKNIV